MGALIGDRSMSVASVERMRLHKLFSYADLFADLDKHRESNRGTK